MPRKLISVREGAKRLDIPTTDLYRARRRGTIVPATGADVPRGIWFEEPEFLRWAAERPRLQRQGRPRSTPP